MRRKGFTLVELLTVVAVLTLLVALLLPALATAQEQVRRVRCAGNLHQLMQAVLSYAHDNRGKLPGVATSPQRDWDWIYWAETATPPFQFKDGPLLRYMGGATTAVFRCPSDDVSVRRRGGAEEAYPYSYGINVYVADAPLSCCTSRGCRLSEIRNSSDKVLFTEPDERKIQDGMWLPPAWHDGVGDPDHLTSRHDPRERSLTRRRSNVGFLDGHVQFVPAAYAESPSRLTPGPASGAALTAFWNHFIR